jgi:hypothetical protein
MLAKYSSRLDDVVRNSNQMPLNMDEFNVNCEHSRISRLNTQRVFCEINIAISIRGVNTCNPYSIFK